MLRTLSIPFVILSLMVLTPDQPHAENISNNELSISRATEKPAPGTAKALSLDLAGAASWGPSLDFEIGSTWVFQARLRFPNGGFLNHADLGDESELGLSGGAGVGVRWYPLTNYFRRKHSDRRLSSLYLGVLLEYLHIHGERVSYDWHYGSLVPQAQLGYRWRKGNWIFGVGADAGVIANVFRVHDYWHGRMQEAPTLNPIPLLEGTLEVGYVF